MWSGAWNKLSSLQISPAQQISYLAQLIELLASWSQRSWFPSLGGNSVYFICQSLILKIFQGMLTETPSVEISHMLKKIKNCTYATIIGFTAPLTFVKQNSIWLWRCNNLYSELKLTFRKVPRWTSTSDFRLIFVLCLTYFLVTICFTGSVYFIPVWYLIFQGS